MPETDSKSPNKKMIRGSALHLAALIVALAVVVGGIEFARRPRAPSQMKALPSGSPRPFPRELRDAEGASLIISNEPQRIVSETLGTDEILLTICPPERIVALSNLAGDSNYSNVVEQARRIPGRVTQNAEEILRFKPDLVFVASYSRAEMVELLRAAKTPVFRFANFDSIADIKSNIRMVGYAIGSDSEAERVIREMDAKLDAIRARIPRNREPVRVMSYDRLGYTAGAHTIFDDLLRTVGAVNISAEHGINRFAKISSEKIAEWQPDFIVVGAEHNEFELMRSQLLKDPIVATSKAGRAGHIVVIDYRHFLTVSHHVVQGVEDLANGFYGNQN